MVNVRKLAAADLLFLGPRIVIPEFALGLVLLVALGMGSMARHGWHSLWMWYMVAIGLNYAPLLYYAIVIARRGSVARELAGESRAAMRRFRTQQFWILVPLAIVAAALWQARWQQPQG